MKPLLAVVVGASLALNALLIAWSLHAAFATSETVAPPTLSARVDASARSKNPIVTSDAWRALDTSDLPALVERLRRAGFPRRHIHAIVAARVEALFTARRRALLPERDRLPFWKMLPPPGAETQAALEALRKEQAKLMWDLLGENANSPDAVVISDRRQNLTHLSPEKAERANAVLTRYDEMSAAVYRSTRGSFTPEDRERLGAIERERRTALAEVLTAQELADYELRASPTASQMRADLWAFRPTEDEFRAIFALQRPFDERFNVNQGGSLDTVDRRKEYYAAHEEFQQQIAAVLGPQRFADYERANDYGFQQTARLVDRLALPPDTATQLWTVQKEIEQRVATVRDDSSLTPEQLNQRLAALAAEASKRATLLLGPRGFDAYRTYGGTWLQDLAPRPPRQ